MKHESNPWMYVSVLLGVLLVVTVSLNFLTYQTLGNALGGSNPIGGGTVPQQAVVVPPTQQGAPAPQQIVNPDLTGTYAKGPANAPVTIVEYSDFQCPFCGRATPTIEAVTKKYGDKVRLIYKHFPLSFHPNAQPAAEASECAGEQGKFWQFHDKLFANQETLSADNYKLWAKELGLDLTKFNSCVDTRKYQQKVQTQFSQGSADGVSGTPTFYINGKQIVGAQPQQAFEQIIDAELNG